MENVHHPVLVDNEEIFPNNLMKNEPRCFAYKTTYDAVTLIAHCNTIGAYFETNKSVRSLEI